MLAHNNGGHLSELYVQDNKIGGIGLMALVCVRSSKLIITNSVRVGPIKQAAENVLFHRFTDE